MRILLVLMLAMPCLHAASWQEQVVASVIMGEARGEGRTGMIAVGEVIRQRCCERKQTPFQVVTARKEFSSKNGCTAAQMVRRYSKIREWATALSVADLVCNSPERLPGITRQANCFDHKNGHPSWLARAELRATIGNHAFYRVAN
jgi:spore germination cell wall hydrolase CwlJ-like protein